MHVGAVTYHLLLSNASALKSDWNFLGIESHLELSYIVCKNIFKFLLSQRRRHI